MSQQPQNHLQPIGHLFIGIMLLMKGYDKIEHHYILVGSIILTFGIIIVSYFIYRLVKKINNHTLLLVVHLFEGIALLFTAYAFFREGKIYLPWVSLAAGIAFLVVFFVHLKKHKKA